MHSNPFQHLQVARDFFFPYDSLPIKSLPDQEIKLIFKNKSFKQYFSEEDTNKGISVLALVGSKKSQIAPNPVAVIGKTWHQPGDRRLGKNFPGELGSF